MCINEYLRNLKSKKTFIILPLILISCISFFISLSDKTMFIGQLSSTSPDLNKAALLAMLKNYTGVRFFFDFWFNSDFSLLFSLVLFLFIGIFLSSSMEQQRENGFGTVLITRCTYRRYFNSVLLAQSLYLCTIIALACAGALLCAFGLGGIRFHLFSIGDYALKPPAAMLVIAVHILWIMLYAVLLNAICLCSNVIIKNKYVIQSLPVVAFSLLPMLAASTVGNLVPAFGKALIWFIPWNGLKSVEFVFQEHFSTESILLSFLPIAAYMILFVILYTFHIKKFSEDYV